MSVKAWWVILFSGFLVGCTTVGPTPSKPSAALSVQQITALKQWTLDGQLAFNNTATQTGFSASMHWLNDRNSNRIDVAGPLGLWHATLSDAGKQASLQLSDGRHFVANSLEALMQANLNWFLPVTPLHYWLFAVPQPRVPATLQRDAQGRITDLEQANWRVHYDEYQNIDGYSVPRRIELHQDAVRIRLVIQRWQLTL